MDSVDTGTIGTTEVMIGGGVVTASVAVVEVERMEIPTVAAMGAEVEVDVIVTVTMAKTDVQQVYRRFLRHPSQIVNRRPAQTIME
jgi:hypothetical protein